MSRQPSDGLAALVAWQTGTTAPAPGQPADPADVAQHVVELLRAVPDDPVARQVAAGFEAWLRQGGDVGAHLGLKPRRGGAYDVPARAVPIRRRDQRLRELAASLNVPNKSGALFDLVRTRNVLILRIEADTCAVPESTAQLKRILRAPADS